MKKKRAWPARLGYIFAAWNSGMGGAPLFSSDSSRTRQMRLISLAVAIPTMLVVGPLLGTFLGKWIGGFFEKPVLGLVIGLCLGFSAGVRETIRLIRRLMQEMKK